mmetsp:Transcript_1128/g.1869  ORF Transcript_1128/g.1869 Transcript_1128/m.1869 type:complete len:152 (-) Transcript_1128:268-723(-)
MENCFNTSRQSLRMKLFMSARTTMIILLAVMFRLQSTTPESLDEGCLRARKQITMRLRSCMRVPQPAAASIILSLPSIPNIPGFVSTAISRASNLLSDRFSGDGAFTVDPTQLLGRHPYVIMNMLIFSHQTLTLEWKTSGLKFYPWFYNYL